MTARSVQVELAGAVFDVLPGRALFWRARRMLVVADVHLGKAAAFRALGVPVPEGTTQGSLARLSRLIEATDPATVVFLGDLLHAPAALNPRTLDAFSTWREHHFDVAMILVEGNHDARAGNLPASLNVERVREPWKLDGVALRHHPVAEEGAVVLAGHLHPVVTLRGPAVDAARLPCFWLRAGVVVLPAFGDFTGGASFAREASDRVLAIADDRLFDIPSVLAA